MSTPILGKNDACIEQVRDMIDAVPASTTATVDVPDECPVAPAAVNELGPVVLAAEFAVVDGHMSATKLLVKGIPDKAQ